MTPEKALPTIALAASADLRDELTIILNALAEVIETTEQGTYERNMAFVAHCAAQRCVWKVCGLADYVSVHLNAKPQPLPMERVMLAASLF